VALDDDVRGELAQLDAAGRLRVPRLVETPPGATIIIDGAEVLNFASNDYLGLAGDPRLAAAARAALEHHGVGAGGSRLITGNHRLHVALEAAVASWMECSGVRLFNSGYAANVGVLTALLKAGDIVFSDKLNHASIIDGCRLSRAEIVVFPHRDLSALETVLRRKGGRRRIVVSETLFSMDGDVADVVGLAALCARHDAALILDEAHAIAVHGPQGRGIAAANAVVPDVLIGTFGKALGTFGAFAATTRAIADLLWNRARSLVFSTGLPPSIAAASARAIELVRSSEGEERRRTLVRNARRLRELVPRCGGLESSAIAPIVIGDDRKVMAISERLHQNGVFVQGIRPPTVSIGTARLRVSLSAAHELQHVEKAAEAIHNAVRHDQ
jgi:8-amino-7-oxononanoate synthase